MRGDASRLGLVTRSGEPRLFVFAHVFRNRERGALHHVGHTSSFDAKARRELAASLREFMTEDESEGFGGGRAPERPAGPRSTGGRRFSSIASARASPRRA